MEAQLQTSSTQNSSAVAQLQSQVGSVTVELDLKGIACVSYMQEYTFLFTGKKQKQNIFVFQWRQPIAGR